MFDFENGNLTALDRFAACRECWLVLAGTRAHEVDGRVEEVDWTASVGDQSGLDAKRLQKFHLKATDRLQR